MISSVWEHLFFIFSSSLSVRTRRCVPRKNCGAKPSLTRYRNHILQDLFAEWLRLQKTRLLCLGGFCKAKQTESNASESSCSCRTIRDTSVRLLLTDCFHGFLVARTTARCFTSTTCPAAWPRTCWGNASRSSAAQRTAKSSSATSKRAAPAALMTVCVSRCISMDHSADLDHCDRSLGLHTGHDGAFMQKKSPHGD